MPLLQDIRYGPAYLGTIPGTLKLCEIFFSFIAVILALVGGRSEPLQDAFVVGHAIGTVVSYLLLLMYLTRLAQSLGNILWLQSVYYSLWFIYYVVVSSILMTKFYSNQSITAGAFGIMSAVAYLCDSIITFQLEPPTCLK